ncbi:uncharacterized protein BO80DRAFT_458539 [Aspergillus ibericus CBS 121593]|uniref:BZIP domain-containing protein n=1 Tax=Aspergillus ibericus CBS 121593 TaxID=1448316 RepID=A0A395GN63_9EURO|nr:hypothetical protein BO80DRAFT_458539 [Aspergillus ibericus CBS 121593]RAK96945.1 hypothetical protein BO80DRAFT_458539 [Aspergillus ibericus CBS 121593]
MLSFFHLAHRSYNNSPSRPTFNMRYAAIVNELVSLLDKLFPYATGMEALEQAIQTTLQYEIPEMESYGLTSAAGFLNFATWLVDGWIPTESAKGRDIYYVLCIFYFVLDQIPLRNCQTAIRPENVGRDLSELSQWIVKFAQEVGNHMNRPESLNEASLTTFWNAPSFHLAEADESKTEGGRWRNFNDFFSRHLKDGARPIDGEGDDRIAVFPADSTFSGYWDITDESMVELKGLPWHIGDLLGPYKSEYGDSFKGGVWLHSFLNTFDYHRQHSPVGGTIKVIDVIPGAAYLDVEYQRDTRSLVPKRPMRPIYASGPIFRGAEATDKEGYQFLQARGIIIIENDKLGTVAVLPIGMAQVSSVVVRDDLKPGSNINKGDEISHFEFGGSDIVVMFQENKIDMKSLPQPLSRGKGESKHTMPPQTRGAQCNELVGKEKRKPIRRDPEKRRQQNIRAQRKYREKLRERMSRLEALAEASVQTSAIERVSAAGTGPFNTTNLITQSLLAQDVSDLTLVNSSVETPGECQHLVRQSDNSPSAPTIEDSVARYLPHSDRTSSTMDTWDSTSYIDPSLLTLNKPNDSLELYWTTTIDCGCSSPHFHIRTENTDPLHYGEVRIFRFGSSAPAADPYANNLRIDRVCTITALYTLGTHLGITEDVLCAEEALSPFFRSSTGLTDDMAKANMISTVQGAFKALKPDMRPNIEQITVEHHPYIDILPFPTLRRNLITHPEYIDEDEFFHDVLTGLVCWGGAGIGRRDRQLSMGYASTGTPWDVRSWEAKVWFLKKYWTLLGGEEGELVRQSEWWRSIRGDETIDIGVHG